MPWELPGFNWGKGSWDSDWGDTLKCSWKKNKYPRILWGSHGQSKCKWSQNKSICLVFCRRMLEYDYKNTTAYIADACPNVLIWPETLHSGLWCNPFKKKLMQLISLYISEKYVFLFSESFKNRITVMGTKEKIHLRFTPQPKILKNVNLLFTNQWNATSDISWNVISLDTELGLYENQMTA